MKNDGTAAEDAFVAHWQARGHIQRFRDKKDLAGLNRGARLADFAKPSDYIVSSPTCPLHYAEVKSTTHEHSFSFSKIQPGQSSAALQEASRGAGSYIFYIFSYATGQWYLMTCAQYAAFRASGKKSVKFKELATWDK